jgi:hypothetical protein
MDVLEETKICRCCHGISWLLQRYTLQSNLSIAIVVMTENKTIVLDDNSVVLVSKYSIIL